MIQFSKFDHTNKKNLFHTSAHAQAAYGESVGAGGGQTFQQRQQLQYERAHVAGYNHSRIGRSFGVVRPKTAQELASARQQRVDRGSQVPSREQLRGAVQSPASQNQFRGRSYDPYA